MSRYIVLVLLSLALTLTESVPVKEDVETDDEQYEATKQEEPSYTAEWQSYYDAEALSRQPKWRLAADQPYDNSYEVREYAEGWWVTSFTPCHNQSVATGFAYLKLYLYMTGYNYQKFKYPLTYPILTKVELDDGSQDPKERIECKEKFSQNFYLPITLKEDPASTPDESISVAIVPKRKYYVRRYEDDLTPEGCNIQAGVLAASLAKNEVEFNPISWYCARYEQGNRVATSNLEVWVEAINEDSFASIFNF